MVGVLVKKGVDMFKMAFRTDTECMLNIR